MAGKTLSFKVVLEEHDDAFVAYPLGIVRGVVIGAGSTREEALSDLKSALAFHLETFGQEEFCPDSAEINASLETATLEV